MVIGVGGIDTVINNQRDSSNNSSAGSFGSIDITTTKRLDASAILARDVALHVWRSVSSLLTNLENDIWKFLSRISQRPIAYLSAEQQTC